MTDEDILEAHITHKIRRYQQQIIGLQYQMQMQRIILERLKRDNYKGTARKTHRIEQLLMFAC